MEYRLQVFCRVAEQQSVSAAARLLRISQPAVTQHVRALEETHGVALFTRSRRGVALTEAGALLLAHARQVAALDEAITAKLKRPEAALGGRLRIGASTTIMQYFLPEKLAAFKQRHAAVEVELVPGNSDAIIGALLAQRIDLGLIEAPCRRRDLRAESFYEDEIVAITNSDDPAIGSRAIPLAKWQERPLIFRELGSGTRESVEAALQQAGLNLKKRTIAQEFPSTEAIKRAVAAGMGIGFVARIAVAQEIASGALAILKLKDVEIRRNFSVILPLGPDAVGLRQVFCSSSSESGEEKVG